MDEEKAATRCNQKPANMASLALKIRDVLGDTVDV